MNSGEHSLSPIIFLLQKRQSMVIEINDFENIREHPDNFLLQLSFGMQGICWKTRDRPEELWYH